MSLDFAFDELPISHRSVGETLADIRFDEFSTSPVDEIVRAIASWSAVPQQPHSTRYLSQIIEPITVIFDANFVIRNLLENIERNWGVWAENEITQLHWAPANQAGQFGLSITGDFSPSKRLTEIWTSGLSALGNEAGLPTAGAADFEVAQEFSHTLSALLGTIAHRLRFQHSPDLEITRGLKFTPGYQIQVCDAFLIIPDQAAEFLQLLRSEIAQAMETGCEISGAWGKVAVSSSGDLRYQLTEAEFVIDPDFEESEEIE